MARGHRSSRRRSYSGTGYYSTPSYPAVPDQVPVRRLWPTVPPVRPKAFVPLPSNTLASRMARHAFHPAERPLRPTTRSTPRNVRVSPDDLRKLQFANPIKEWVCFKRKIRREVLHALDLVNRRKGSGGGRKRRWTVDSFIGC